MNLLNLDQESFNETIKKDGIIVVDFWAPWCGPCRNFAPIFEEASKKYKDILFVKINIDNESKLASSLNIRSIPTILIYKNQEIVYSKPGSLSAKQLEEIINTAKQ
ncbi:thioredoxin [Candidatus Kinetoplastidibacterium crithidiae]|uniref:Thioredoxin n=1 Tax=Candidatus Kinetoplastidibacterium crithidiae TCC036E TaxID=1208918 RepID=M1LPF2_9PROT|nr:thioredoxin [Candidatus Kinetoplastibacterium crithidii]AFZ82795.1 thioredoxin 2 [Candidatus Kinetoplastibacterium crithidii (ex Angomonas deanei ATCC 30255)]AGF47552.1 TRX-family thioredoxin [Candidatus Kinetoplastibacterium crithidii TCC036E]